MANDRQELMELEELERLEAKETAYKQAGPQPYQPADNQDKIKATVQPQIPFNTSFQATMNNDEAGQTAHSDRLNLAGLASGLAAEGSVAGVAPAARGIGSLLQGAVKIGKATTSPLETLDKVGKWFSNVGTKAAPEVPSQMATEAPVSIAKALEGERTIDPTKINLDSIARVIRPNNSKWDFPIRKRGLGVE